MRMDTHGSDEGSSKKSMTASLASVPWIIRQMFGEIDEEKARVSPRHGGWCLIEILVHLGDVEARYRGRLVHMLSEAAPHVPAIWPRLMPDPLPRLHEALVVFELERAKTVAFLTTLAEEDWRRDVQHATLGQSTFIKQVQGLIEHDEDHLKQIAETGKLIGACLRSMDVCSRGALGDAR